MSTSKLERLAKVSREWIGVDEKYRKEPDDMVKSNQVSSMQNDDEFAIRVVEPTSSSELKTSKKPKKQQQQQPRPPNEEPQQLNDLKSTTTTDMGKWTEPREVDYLFAARIVKDARDLRNLTFKKTENNLK